MDNMYCSSVCFNTIKIGTVCTYMAQEVVSDDSFGWYCRDRLVETRQGTVLNTAWNIII